MSASSILPAITRRAAAAALVAVGLAALPGAAEARDRFSFSTGFDSWGGSGFSLGYSTGDRWGHRDWGHRSRGHRSWGHRGWGNHGWRGDYLSLGFTYVAPPLYYSPRPYYAPRPYFGYPASPAGGVVVFSPIVRDRLGARTRTAYYDAYRSALAAPVGAAINWSDERAEGEVTTTRDGWAGDRYCREFRQNIIIDGRTEEAFCTACRNAADTDWEIIPD